ncbi:lysylphosphatidylglycerol synthase domain-containing protein, partial [Actinosynnema sp. NPDC059797]
ERGPHENGTTTGAAGTGAGTAAPPTRRARALAVASALGAFLRRPGVRRATTALVVLLCAAFLARSLAADREAAAAALGRLGPWLLPALVAAVVGLWLTALSWREPLQALSRPLGRVAAVRLFAAGSLGKYVPGVMWSIVLQTRLAASSGITVFHFTATFGLYAAVSLATGAALGLPTLLRYAHGGWTALGAAALAFAALLVMPWLLATAVRLLRRVPALARRLAEVPADVLRRSVWLCAVSWVVTGLHLWLLVVALGADPVAALLPCLGGFALATSVASLVVVVPDGIGVREALLAVSLASLLPAPEAVAAAAASRLVLAAADVLAFAYGSFTARRRTLDPT